MCSFLFLSAAWNMNVFLTYQEQDSIATTSMKTHARDTDLKRNMPRKAAHCIPYEYFCILYNIPRMRLTTKGWDKQPCAGQALVKQMGVLCLQLVCMSLLTLTLDIVDLNK
jgi:hypothetical protein